jgi:hypothetical protein
MPLNLQAPGRLLPLVAALCAVTTIAVTAPALASSHREAPFMTTAPKVDASDFYLFNSYEANHADTVVLIANYQPLQDPSGGPNFFEMDPNALYEIHVDNNGDGVEDVTFQFKFQNKLNSVALPIGGKNVPIPLVQAGVVSAPAATTLNVNETFTLDVVRGPRRSTGNIVHVASPSGGTSFNKPVDNIGNKTVPNYAAYAAQHIYSVNIPGCGASKVFVGQRKDPFRVNLAVLFDLVNAPASVITNPALIDAGTDSLANKNVTTMALEVPRSCLVAGTDPVIGGWTTASLRQGSLLNPTPPSGLQTTAKVGGAWSQVSRLGNPLINEVVIGLPDKDKFNASSPSGDAQFINYVTNPTLPALIEIALGMPNIAPTNFPRTDLTTVFLTGITGLNQPANVKASEMLRLNTAVPSVALANQNRLGVLGGDKAGFPNGRRPHDDVVDIALAAEMGALCVANGTGNALGLGTACTPAAVPLGATAAKLHDAVDQAVAPLLPAFPYLNTPIPGAVSAQ